MEKLFNDSFENWIFDLDNTIYDIKAGLFVKISERITDYIMKILSLTKEEANLVRSDMYKKYGLTLTGLMREYGIDNVRGGAFCQTKLSNSTKETIKKLIDRYFNLLASLFFILLVGSFLFIKFI